jgi:hypothetical protein
MNHQSSKVGSQVLQKVEVFHHATDIGIKALVGCSIEVVIAATTDGLFD